MVIFHSYVSLPEGTYAHFVKIMVSTSGDDLLADAPKDHKKFHPDETRHARSKKHVISSLPLAGFWKKCVFFFF